MPFPATRRARAPGSSRRALLRLSGDGKFPGANLAFSIACGGVSGRTGEPTSGAGSASRTSPSAPSRGSSASRAGAAAASHGSGRFPHNLDDPVDRREVGPRHGVKGNEQRFVQPADLEREKLGPAVGACGGRESPERAHACTSRRHPPALRSRGSRRLNSEGRRYAFRARTSSAALPFAPRSTDRAGRGVAGRDSRGSGICAPVGRKKAGYA